MTTRSEKINRYRALKPIQFTMVTRFDLSTVPALLGFSRRLTIHLRRPSLGYDEEVLVLEFDGVRNVRLVDQGLKAVLLEIADASPRQWEGVNYQIFDREGETISFLCRDFSASLQNVNL